MTLHVAEDSPTEAYVWVDGVPPGMSDADVEASVRELAEAGDKTAVRALVLVPYWLRMNATMSGSRCYRDGT